MASKMQNKFVSKSISKLYLQSKTADVHFAFTTDDETVKVPAHKAILASASPVFDAMFFGSMKENDVVEIVDADVSVFKEFLQLFYLPEVTLTMGNIEAVTRLADKYDMLKCLNECAELLQKKLTKNNVIWSYQLAISLKNQNLQQICENRIQAHATDVFKSNEFKQCDRAVFEHILHIDPLYTSEGEVFKACVEWAKLACQVNGLDENNTDDLRLQLGDCFYLIRFGAMAIDEIGMILANEQYKGLFSRDELADLFCIKSDGNFEFKALRDTQRSVRAFKWNGDNVLECKRVNSSSNNNATVHNRESTWFSTNVRLILGELTFIQISHSQSWGVNFSSIMYIIEYDEQAFTANVPTKIIYTGTVSYVSGQSSPSVSLRQPIVIHPNKMYEVRLETTSSMAYNYHRLLWKSEVKLDEETTIKFHQSPFEVSSTLRGLVSSLRFNRIQHNQMDN